MKLTATQLRSIIREEVQKVRSRRGLNEDSATDTEIEFTKEELMRSLSSASAELSNLAELTGNQAYSDAGTQIASIMELVDNL
jgi:hypothetical protein